LGVVHQENHRIVFAQHIRPTVFWHRSFKQLFALRPWLMLPYRNTSTASVARSVNKVRDQALCLASERGQLMHYLSGIFSLKLYGLLDK
jgi:hypothetical protein